MALQMNSTYQRAIKITPYEVVFNRKAFYTRVFFNARHLPLADIEEQEVADIEDDILIYQETDQLRVEQEVRATLIGGSVASIDVVSQPPEAEVKAHSKAEM